jgi:hypothetical protein
MCANASTSELKLTIKTANEGLFRSWDTSENVLCVYTTITNSPGMLVEEKVTKRQKKMLLELVTLQAHTNTVSTVYNDVRDDLKIANDAIFKLSDWRLVM